MLEERTVNKTEFLPSYSLRETENTYTKEQTYKSDCDKSYGENPQRVRRVENAIFGGRVGCNFK